MASPITESFGASGIVPPRLVRPRAQSISSDRQSTIGFGLVLPPLSVSPESCYIAHSAASQIITNDHDSHADAWYDQNGIEPAIETAMISSSALQLVNGFLDQLLFNFLQIAQSTSFSALRPAIIEVLKPKLAKDAISNAEEELQEYLGGANDDDCVQPQGASIARNWDSELAWKRTRLRCMVYSSLGDMEEDDEDRYMAEENLELGTNEQNSDIVSPAVAIFLTSVLEYMGELTLTVAGQSAYQRVRSKIEKELKEGARDASNPAERIVVSAADMERVALDRTLGRLWRGWKKRMRTPVTDVAGRPSSKNVSIPLKHEHAVSGQITTGIPKSAISDNSSDRRRSQDQLELPIVEDVKAKDIPLPISDNDVNEIEVPGLAYYSDEEDDRDSREGQEIVSKRPKSLSLSYTTASHGLPTSRQFQSHNLLFPNPRKRSQSLPSRAVPKFLHWVSQPGKDSSHSSEVNPNRAAESNETCLGRKNIEVLEAKVTASEAPASEDGQVDDSDYDSAEEVAYEKAEIMTSSRVSVSSSFHSMDSDSNSRPRHCKRSSSVQSARIVDVSAPKTPSPRSPAHYRPGSWDNTDRSRPVTLSGVAVVSALARPAAGDNRLKSAGLAINEKPLPITPTTVEEKLPHQGTSISERHENQTGWPANGLALGEAAPGATAVLAAGSITTATISRRRGPPVKINTNTQSHLFEQTLISARAVPLPASPVDPVVDNKGLPGLPRGASNRVGTQSPNAESKSLSTIGRTRTRESDEASTPLQNSLNTRQIHTAASSVSSAASRAKPLQISEDDSSHSESVARNFEELIQSNQTITYTLTPENMRDFDSKSPVLTKLARRKSEDVWALSSPKLPPTTVQSSPRGLPSTSTSPKVVESNNSSSKTSVPVQRAAADLAISASSEGGTEAREARVPAETMSDFAEFIKSTGPAEENKVYHVAKLSSPASQMPGGSRRASTTSSLLRSRYQPRDAAVDSRASNSDLIDFIRQGPPIAPSSHRIPRHVAPFRTTMDSDEMSVAIGGKAVDASLPDFRDSQGSANITGSSMLSMHSSINSKSALLRNRRTSAAKHNQILGEEDGIMPARKTRRARDPYAIDFSDEEGEDDDVAETPRVPAKKEESLAEFLRNYQPPPGSAVSAAPQVGRKKASGAPKIMGRLSRGGKDKDRDDHPASMREAQEARHSRAGGRGYVPIMVNMPADYDMYGPADACRTPVSRSGGTSTVSSTAGRVPMKKFEPREAVARSHTADLAAFLRDSEPPPHNSPIIDRTERRQEEAANGGGGISKMFNRRKKSLII